ncbi:MAG: hypothetical protein ACO1RT_00945 [Planctomycetaceae bacterium]
MSDRKSPPTGFEALWKEAAAIWERHHAEPSFEGYVSADYSAVYRSLQKLQNRCSTFLEWGSGLGVVTIMASQMGFDAYGIEIEPDLVDHANTLAQRYGSRAKFACGSFVPEQYEEQSLDGEEFQRTVCDAVPAYDELDMQLCDFDLVYAYPWPEEHLVFRSIMRRCGARRAVLVCYDAREGVSTTVPRKRRV